MSFNILHKISSIFTKSHPKYLDIIAIERLIHYRFRNHELLITAFKHSSYLPVTKEKAHKSNERLEFLGDAVLDLVVTNFLYNKLPTTLEGDLSKMKSVLVSRSVLAEVVSDMGMGTFLLINRGEEKTGGRSRTSNLANLYEAILGAIYLDGGLPSAQKFIKNTLLDKHKKLLKHKDFINYKSLLLEYVQSSGPDGPVYQLVRESGPDHEKRFVMNVSIGEDKNAHGEGKSKKLAEQAAAYNLLKEIAPNLLSKERKP
jgi:ribonuclease-3